MAVRQYVSSTEDLRVLRLPHSVMRDTPYLISQSETLGKIWCVLFAKWIAQSVQAVDS
jgi:hypothetical protein